MPVKGRQAIKEVKTKNGRRTIDLDGKQSIRLGRNADVILRLRRWNRVGPGKARSRRDSMSSHARTCSPNHDPLGAAHARNTTAPHRRTINVVSKRLGHANESIILTLYAHLLPDMVGQAANVAGSR
jgi:hypothetical protein